MLPSYPESTMRALARNILTNTLRMKRGENLFIDTWSATLPWAQSFVLEARILGARPMLTLEDEETYWKSVKEAPAAHVAQVGSHDWAALKASHAYMYFYGPLDVERMDSLPNSVKNRLYANDNEWFRLVEKLGIRVARWDLGRTSEAVARRYGISLAQWRGELVEAGSLDPRPLQKDGQRIAEAMRRGRELRITHPNGTDLTLRLARRTPRVDDGVIDPADVRSGNIFSVIPSGVTSTSVDEGFAEGTVVSNMVGAMFVHGEELMLAGAEWTFRRGRLEKYTHTSGGDAFRSAFSKLGPGKDRPGLVSVGLNPAIHSIPLLFDQERGIISVTVGRNSQVGGRTRTPHFTAYSSIRGGSLAIDGRPYVEAGELV
ncbi:MAG: aminopeptidase [Thermoplasmata archaeon]|nr:aminopeptidase [Thermoplasmata archaeon]